MEGIGQIVILLVLLVATIVQQSIKSKKKRQEHGTSVNQEKKNSTTFEDVWRDLFETGEEQPEDEPYVFSSEKDSKETGMVREYENRVFTAQRSRGGESQIQTKNTRYNETPLQVLDADGIDEEQSEFMKEFDVRKAIIYSEIITPKFKEG